MGNNGTRYGYDSIGGYGVLNPPTFEGEDIYTLDAAADVVELRLGAAGATQLPGEDSLNIIVPGMGGAAFVLDWSVVTDRYISSVAALADYIIANDGNTITFMLETP